METEIDLKMYGSNNGLALDSIRIIKRLAPLLHRAPEGDKRTDMLKDLRNKLDHMQGYGTTSLEFIGFLNADRFTKALGIRPEDVSGAFKVITYDNIGTDPYTARSFESNVNNIVVSTWPQFNPENKSNAIIFARELVKYIDKLLKPLP